MTYETVYTFRTARFEVALEVAPEETDPADHFDCAEDIEFANEGGWHWFRARAVVSFIDDNNPKKWAIVRQRVLGEDYLGGCSCTSLKDFRQDGTLHDMVREAITEARGTLTRLCSAV